MTEQTARTVANIVLGAAAVAAGYVILRTPSLRRMAAGLIVASVTGGVPRWFGREVQHAWNASNLRREAGAASPSGL
jgi:hypothetical protein